MDKAGKSGHLSQRDISFVKHGAFNIQSDIDSLFLFLNYVVPPVQSAF